jgi:hypothetical protein
MSKLFLNPIEDFISVINANLPEVVLNTLSKSDLEHRIYRRICNPKRQLNAAKRTPERATEGPGCVIDDGSGF